MFIDHAAVYVEDLERGARFYEQYFGGVRGGGMAGRQGIVIVFRQLRRVYFADTVPEAFDFVRHVDGTL